MVRVCGFLLLLLGLDQLVGLDHVYEKVLADIGILEAGQGVLFNLLDRAIDFLLVRLLLDIVQCLGSGVERKQLLNVTELLFRLLRVVAQILFVRGRDEWVFSL